jgi:hypothetical protein
VRPPDPHGRAESEADFPALADPPGAALEEAPSHLAKVAELADALDSGSSGVKLVEVQVLSFAPNDLAGLRWSPTRASAGALWSRCAPSHEGPETRLLRRTQCEGVHRGTGGEPRQGIEMPCVARTPSWTHQQPSDAAKSFNMVSRSSHHVVKRGNVQVSRSVRWAVGRIPR